MTEILPLIYFTHADLKTKENLNVDLELVKTDNDLKKSSFDSKRLSKKIKLQHQIMINPNTDHVIFTNKITF